MLTERMNILILVIDVGNTNMVFGVYENDELKASWRKATLKNITSDEIGLFILSMFQLENISHHNISGVIISSVVPPIMYSLEHAIRKYLDHDPIIVDSRLDFGIKIKVDNPKEVGADRLVNAYAAYNLYGGPLIIVDFGTATTFCGVSGNCEYLGGAICPGVKISLEALYQNTAKLPRIEIAKPKKMIGSNTVESMQSGVLFSYVGGVDYIVNGFKKELGENAKTIATGGLARMIAKESKTIDITNSRLTLDGLNMIYKNCIKYNL